MQVMCVHTLMSPNIKTTYIKTRKSDFRVQNSMESALYASNQVWIGRTWDITLLQHRIFLIFLIPEVRKLFVVLSETVGANKKSCWQNLESMTVQETHSHIPLTIPKPYDFCVREHYSVVRYNCHAAWKD